jgi:monoamine oxidase
LNPDGQFYVTGDQVSQLPGWQEGAMESAQHVVELINKPGLILEAPPRLIRAPNTRRLVQGR